MAPFNPDLLDTSDVVLPLELLDLAENVSKTVHDVRLQTRDRNTTVGTLKYL